MLRGSVEALSMLRGSVEVLSRFCRGSLHATRFRRGSAEVRPRCCRGWVEVLSREHLRCRDPAAKQQSHRGSAEVRSRYCRGAPRPRGNRWKTAAPAIHQKQLGWENSCPGDPGITVGTTAAPRSRGNNWKTAAPAIHKKQLASRCSASQGEPLENSRRGDPQKTIGLGKQLPRRPRNNPRSRRGPLEVLHAVCRQSGRVVSGQSGACGLSTLLCLTTVLLKSY
jgi:hypothetical protein